MREQDIDEFTAVWEAAHELYGRSPTDTATALAFKVLERYTMAEVRRGLEAHLADPDRGRFAPKPADIIAQITGARERDGRPTADEAWATAIKADDEAVTVVWTDETAQAWGVARAIMEEGDQVGARMAFRAAYDRAVTEAREHGRPVRWTVSMGQDPRGREEAINAAVETGKIAPERAARLIPGPMAGGGSMVKLLESAMKGPEKDKINKHLQEIMRKLGKAEDEQPG